MSIRLIVEVLDDAPADLTPAERLVLVVLAENANDETRRGWPGMEVLMRRTGLKQDSLRKVFQRLAARGLEVRESTTTADGKRQVVAHHGHRTVYRIPNFTGSRDADPALKEGPSSRLDDGKGGPQSGEGGTVVRERRDGGPAKGGRASRPSPHEPSSNPQKSLSPQATTPDSLLTELGADERERDEVIQKIKNECQPQTLGWWITASRNGTLLGHLEAHRAGGSAGSGMPAWCGTCDKDTRQIEAEDQYGGGTRPRRCPDCHPSVVRQPPPARRQNGGWGGPHLNSTDPHAFDGYKPHARENVNAYQPYRDKPTRDYRAPL